MEFWDIYDVNKQPTGRTMKRNDWTMQDGDYHLTVLGIVTAPDGRFLVTKRAMNKEWAPGAFEVSGGGVQAGETSLSAVIREVSEETGLPAEQGVVTLVDTYRSDSPKEHNNYFVDIYHVAIDFTEADVHAQESETEGFRLMTLDQIKAEGEADNFLHYKRLLPALTKISDSIMA